MTTQQLSESVEESIVAPQEEGKEESQPTETLEDAQAKVATLEQELKRSNDRASSLEGQAKKNLELDLRSSRDSQMIKALVEHISNPDAEPEELKAKQANIEAMSVQDLAATQQLDLINDLYGGITAIADEIGMVVSDDKFKGIVEEWNKAISNKNDMKGFHKAHAAAVALQIEHYKDQTKNAENTLKNRNNQDNGKLAVGSGARSTGSGFSDQEKVNRLSDPTVTQTPTEVVEAGKLMDQGVYPKF